MATIRTLNPVEESRAAYGAITSNSAIQYTFYTNQLILAILQDLPDGYRDTAELYLRYQAALLGQQLNNAASTENTAAINSAGVLLIAVFQQNITLMIRLIETAKDLGPTGIRNPAVIQQRFAPLIMALQANLLQLANLFTIVGGNKISVADGQVILSQYGQTVAQIIQTTVLGQWPQSLAASALLQTVGLGIGDYMVRCIYGGPIRNYYVGNNEYSGYAVPSSITLEELRNAAAPLDI